MIIYNFAHLLKPQNSELRAIQMRLSNVWQPGIFSELEKNSTDWFFGFSSVEFFKCKM